MLPVNAIQLSELMEHCLEIDSPLMVWGPTGVGKSKITDQVAQRLRYEYLPFILLLRDTVDLRGAPMPDLATGETTWLRPDDLPFVGSTRFDPAKRYLIHLDEINTAPPALQAVAFQLVLERRAGPHVLQPNTRIIACGNRQSDRGAAQKMPVPLENRFRHCLLLPNADAWALQARKDGIRPGLIAFLAGFRPNLLHYTLESERNGQKYDFAEPTHLSPRAWYDVNKSLGLAQPLRQLAVAATVGEGPAAELEAFLGLVLALPPVQDLIAEPHTSPLPDDVANTTQEKLGLRYAVAVALGRIATRQNLGAILAYAARLPREIMMIAVKDAITRDPELMNTKVFTAWAVQNQDVTL